MSVGSRGRIVACLMVGLALATVANMPTRVLASPPRCG